MLTQLIPGTDLDAACICLGTGNFGDTVDRQSAFRILDAYLAAGGNFIDTAKIYSDWANDVGSFSEKTIGAWMAERGTRQKVVLATKGAHPHLHSMLTPRCSPQEIRSDLEDSLRHLHTDLIDLYWLHRDDRSSPVGDILNTLHALQQEGKIRYYGCSNWQTDRIREARDYADKHGLKGFVASQVLWSAADVNPQVLGDPTLAWMDAEMHAYHLNSGLACTPYTSQANGYFNRLANGTLEQMNSGQRETYDSPSNRERFARIQQVMAQRGWSLSQVVLGYLTSQPFATFPIIGCRTLDQLADSLSAGSVRLSAEQVAYIAGN